MNTTTICLKNRQNLTILAILENFEPGHTEGQVKHDLTRPDLTGWPGPRSGQVRYTWPGCRSGHRSGQFTKLSGQQNTASYYAHGLAKLFQNLSLVFGMNALKGQLYQENFWKYMGESGNLKINCLKGTLTRIIIFIA